MLLIACPSCDRQYDVSHLDPGSRVRCRCNAALGVPARGPLVVKALVCSNCRAPVGASSGECPFCGAELSHLDRRATTLCPKCYVRMDESARHCPGCGITIRPQALRPLPERRDCPRCAGELCVRDLGAADVIECTDCAGMWLEPQAFARVQLEAESLPGVLPAARQEASFLEVSDLRYIPCLVCGELMCRRQYRHHGAFSGVVVDLCRTHGIWLDQGELSKILDFVRGRKVPGARGTARDGSGLDRAPERAARPARAERPAQAEAREGREERDISVPDLLARLGVVLG